MWPREQQQRAASGWAPLLQPHSDAIVSLLPGATEILFALGLGHRRALNP